MSLFSFQPCDLNIEDYSILYLKAQIEFRDYYKWVTDVCYVKFAVQKSTLNGQISEIILHYLKCFHICCVHMYPGERSKQFFNTQY